MSNLLKEVVADIKTLRQTQLELAKQQILEDFEPAIKRIVSAKLEAEGMDDEEGFDFSEEETENSLDTDGGFESFEDDEEEPVDEGFGEEEDDELAELMRELDGDGEEDMMVDESDEMEDEFSMDEGYNDEEDMMEAFLNEEDDEDMALEEEDWKDLENVEENRKLKSSNKKLKNQLREALLALAQMKKTINEVNLLNGKLLFNTKIGRKYDLNKKQKTAVLEALDRGRNVREVKLIYATVCEQLNKTTSLRKVTGSSSKPMKFVKPKKSLQENAGVTRMKILAGLIEE